MTTPTPGQPAPTDPTTRQPLLLTVPDATETPSLEEITSLAAFQHELRLISIDPATNRYRFYALAWRPTLWGPCSRPHLGPAWHAWALPSCRLSRRRRGAKGDRGTAATALAAWLRGRRSAIGRRSLTLHVSV